jgi:hypothetical protein
MLPGSDDDDAERKGVKVEGGAGHEWMPDPVDADPSSSRSQRTGDITSLLINIYGSKVRIGEQSAAPGLPPPPPLGPLEEE